MRRWTVVAIVALLLAPLAGCSIFRGQKRPANEETITIHVDNQNFYDATVYLRWFSDRQRLGSVTGHTEHSFETRWRGPTLTVEVSLLAGPTRIAPSLGVSPGDDVFVDIPSVIDRVRVYREP